MGHSYVISSFLVSTRESLVKSPARFITRRSPPYREMMHGTLAEQDETALSLLIEKAVF
jgi:hypothetical protein